MKKYWYLVVSVIVLAVILVGCGPAPESAFMKAYARTDILTSEVDGIWITVIRVIDVQAGVVCYVGNDWGDCFLLEETKLDY